MTRKAVKTYTSKDSIAFFTISSSLEIWGTNSQAWSKIVCLELRAYDVESGTVIAVDAAGWNDSKKEVTLAPNSTTELWKGQTPGIDDVHVDGMRSRAVVIQARLVDIDTQVVLARYSNWFVQSISTFTN
jgi:beta-mannosidase